MLTRFISPREDTLTASVFGNLLHLPLEMFWQLLRASSHGPELPKSCAVLKSVEGWPKWSAEGTLNHYYVEPDLFLRFEEFDLLVEAKRWDGDMQNPTQWKSQLQAYRNEYGEDHKPVHYLAVGGLGTATARVLPVEERISFHHLRWDDLLRQCQRLDLALGNGPATSFQIEAHKRIIADVIEAFAIHGFSIGRWFEDFPTFQQSSTMETSPPILRHLLSSPHLQ